MNSQPPAIVGFHDGETLSASQRLSIRSFLAHGHPYYLYTYGDVAGLPEGARRRDADAVVAEKSTRAPDGGRLRATANRLCWELMAAGGGHWWADLDTVCLKPLNFEQPLVMGFADFNRVAASPLRAAADHPITRAMLRRHRHPERFPHDGAGKCLAMAKAALALSRAPLRAHDDALLADDRLLTLEVMRGAESMRLRPPSDFNPIRAERAGGIFDGAAPKLAALDDSYTLRLHHPSADAVAAATPDSLFGELARLHGEDDG